MSQSEKVVTVRAKAFTGERIRSHRCMVEADGTVRVWDSVAGYYTTCHCLSESAKRRIRKLVAKGA